MHNYFPEIDENHLTGILYDLIYVLVFLDEKWKDGVRWAWGAEGIEAIEGVDLECVLRRVGDRGIYGKEWSIKTKRLHYRGPLLVAT